MNSPSSKFKNIGNYFFNLLLILILGFAVFTKGPSIYNNFKLQFTKPEPANIERLSGELISFPVMGEKKLVIFWMINCPPCKMEMKRVDDMVSTGVLRGDQVIAINFVDAKEQVLQYLKDQPFQYLIAIDNGGKVADLFKVNSTPTVFLINENGGIDWATSGISPTLTFRVKRFFEKI